MTEQLPNPFEYKTRAIKPQNCNVHVCRPRSNPVGLNQFDVISRKEGKLLNDEDVLQFDLWNTSTHEAGHVVVARHFGLEAWGKIWRNEGSDPLAERSFLGRTSHPITTPFRWACIGFAGSFAEALHRREDEDPLSLHEEFHCNEQSASDMEAVKAHHQEWRAAKTAHSILLRRLNEVRSVAQSLASPFLAEFKEQTGLRWN